jgi:hypothetical protein
MTPNSDTDRHDNDLHDLFDAATAGLPPLPDLVPEAHRIVHRRRLATRSLGAALSAALAIGAGTFALDSPWRSGGATGFSLQAGSAPASAERDFKTRAAALLQSVWPVHGETIRPAVGDPQAFVVIAPSGKVYPLTLRTDGTSREGTGSLQVEHTADTLPKGSETDAAIICYRSHVMVSLFIFDTPAALISDAQLRTLESTLLAPGLIEWAVADGMVLPVQGLPVSSSASPSPSVSTPRTSTPSPSPSLTWY